MSSIEHEGEELIHLTFFKHQWVRQLHTLGFRAFIISYADRNSKMLFKLTHLN